LENAEYAATLAENAFRNEEQMHTVTRADLDTLRAACDDLRALFSAANSEKRIWRRLNKLHIAQRDALQRDSNAAQATIGQLIALLAAGAGEDSDEYRGALALVGMVPDGDVSGDDADERRGVRGWY
jgi:hypothetical protein